MLEQLSTYRQTFSYNLRNIIAEARKLWQPKEPLTVSEWAERNRFVSRKESARPGNWENSNSPYAVEIMDAFTDVEVEEITLEFSAQVVKTEIIKNIIGYVIDYDPAPMLVVYPTDGDARDFSNEKLQPMIDNNKCLRDKMAPAKSNSKNNKTLYKEFWGAFLAIAGGRVTQDLARRSVKYVFVDDRNRVLTAGNEGDASELAWQRTESYEQLGRKRIHCSTPTVKDESPITDEYHQGDQRLYYVPCPFCDEYQTLEWENLKWEKILDLSGETKEHLYKTAYYQCSKCGERIEEKHKPYMIEKGIWVAKYPERKSHRSYHLNRLYSLLSSWSSVVKNYLDSRKDETKNQVFINTALARCYKRFKTEEIDETGLMDRAENYLTEENPCVPNAVKFLTFAIDVQPDRLEYQVAGFARGGEPYLIEYDVIYGDTDQEDVWNDVEERTHKKWIREDGFELEIIYIRGIRFPIMCDTGGKNTQYYYKQTGKRFYKGWIGTKGQDGQDKPILLNQTKGGENRNIPLQLVGVDSAKSRIYKMLSLNQAPNKIHFTAAYVSHDYFSQLVSEKAVKEPDRKNRIRWIWKKKSTHARNEVLDLWVLNIAAFEQCHVNFKMLEENQAKALEKKQEEHPSTPEPEKQTTAPPRPKVRAVRKNNFVNGWR